MFFSGRSSNIDNSEARRVYELWPSDGNVILCFGACITGRNPILLMVALLCAVFPYYSFLSTRVPEKGEDAWPISVWFLSVWFLLTIVLLLKISLMDPGIIPRRNLLARIYQIEDAENQTSPVNEDIYDPFKSHPNSTFCYTCEVHRPVGASHCSECNNCVLGFDHHCAVLNNCIGIRNYPFFLALLPCMFMLTISFVMQIKFNPSDSEPGPEAQIPTFLLQVRTIVFIIAILALILVVCFSLYHGWLLFWARTTTKAHLTGRGMRDISIIDRLRGNDSLLDLRAAIQR